EAAKVEDRYRDVLEGAGLELVFPSTGRPGQLSEDELLAALAGIEATVAGSEPYTARVLAAHPQLRVIARVGVGYDAVDVAAATARGVAVTTAPGTHHRSAPPPRPQPTAGSRNPRSRFSPGSPATCRSGITASQPAAGRGS